MARRSRSSRRRSGSRLGGAALGALIILVAITIFWKYWPWFVGAGVLVVAAWVWHLLRRRKIELAMDSIDAMSGQEFERFLTRLFRRLGYAVLHVGRGGGDFGADLVIEKNRFKIAVQAKNYDKDKVGNDAVQQAIAGATYYDCPQAMVVTNSRFTAAARKQASNSSIPVSLWGRRELEQAVRSAQD
ncbi:MAG: restriction endonuclease [Deltaproteobacteria bacterium]|nr:restriction endonuclease [Deltaproteobacteria bacterium]